MMQDYKPRKENNVKTLLILNWRFTDQKLMLINQLGFDARHQEYVENKDKTK